MGRREEFGESLGDLWNLNCCVGDLLWLSGRKVESDVVREVNGFLESDGVEGAGLEDIALVRS